MPKGMGYRTGGKHDGKGLGPYDTGAKSMLDVSTGGAGMGTGTNQPNAKNKTGAGGHGSKGTKSNSTPSKG